jgi:hypothetical protein
LVVRSTVPASPTAKATWSLAAATDQSRCAVPDVWGDHVAPPSSLWMMVPESPTAQSVSVSTAAMPRSSTEVPVA